MPNFVSSVADLKLEWKTIVDHRFLKVYRAFQCTFFNDTVWRHFAGFTVAYLLVWQLFLPFLVTVLLNLWNETLLTALKSQSICDPNKNSGLKKSQNTRGRVIARFVWRNSDKIRLYNIFRTNRHFCEASVFLQTVYWMHSFRDTEVLSKHSRMIFVKISCCHWGKSIK